MNVVVAFYYFPYQTISKNVNNTAVPKCAVVLTPRG